MTFHRLKLVYDGLGAAENRMPESLKRQISEGMQIFVGAQLSYFVEGRVPDRVMERTRYYELHDFQERPACWIAEQDITLTGQVATGYFLGRIAVDMVGDLAKDFIKQAVRNFFVDSMRDWKARRLIMHPDFERIEPVLSLPSVNVPVFHDPAEQERQKRRLYSRMNFAMAKITAPIRRAATQVDVWFDDVQLDHIEQRFFSDEEILEALLPLREFRAHGYH